MSVCRCQVCGGHLILKEDHFAVCDSCRTEQFLPRIDSNVTNLYERANHLRQLPDFDRAAKLFNQVLDRYPKDAATYWQIVLCKFGVYYQKDERTQSFKPTLHRMMRTSLLTDPDYLKALEYATTYERTIYQQEAEEIFRIQQRYERISQNEKAFDVFISYKDTDEETGQRTPDSELAHSLYNDLTAQGLRVFFSHITLRDKSGVDYEPYIFAALESAPVMLLVSTAPQYVNGVWVRNEWMRYLNLIALNEDKVLIPVVRDMDPYDLPDEISHLQAVNLRNVGARQELLQRVMELAKRDKAAAAPQRAENQGASVEPLIAGMYRQLQAGEFKGPQGASSYITRIHAIDPQNSDGFLGRLMIEHQAKTPEQLPKANELLTTSENYRRAMQFGSEAQQTKLVALLEMQQRRIYDECVSAETGYVSRMDANPNAGDLSGLMGLQKRFASLEGYRDAAVHAKSVRLIINRILTEKAKQLEAEKKYEEALELVCQIEDDDHQASMERKLRGAIERRDRRIQKQENKESALKYFAIAIHAVLLVALVIATFFTSFQVFRWYVLNARAVPGYLALAALCVCGLSNGLTCDSNGDAVSFVCTLGHLGIPLLMGINTLLISWQPGTSIFSGDFVDGVVTGLIIAVAVHLIYTLVGWIAAKCRRCDFHWSSLGIFWDLFF